MVPLDMPVVTGSARCSPDARSYTWTNLSSPAPITALTGTVSTSEASATVMDRLADIPSLMLPSLGTLTVTVNLEPVAPYVPTSLMLEMVPSHSRPLSDPSFTFTLCPSDKSPRSFSETSMVTDTVSMRCTSI